MDPLRNSSPCASLPHLLRFIFHSSPSYPTSPKLTHLLSLRFSYHSTATPNPLSHTPSLLISVYKPFPSINLLNLSFRSFSTSTRKSNSNYSIPRSPRIHREKAAQMIDLIVKTNATDIKAKLSGVNSILTHPLVAEVIRALNQRRISALGFFNWILNSHSEFKPNAEAYNLIIDNLGRTEDYSTMLRMLGELSSKRHCLTEKAFTFLTDCSSSNLVDNVRRVVDMLNRVGGSCRGSGIHSLIKTLCAMNFFDLAVAVMEETSRTTSYYNVLIAAKCRNGDFQGARELFDEMRSFGCHPITASYNYLLGCLFKNKRFAEGCQLLETMEGLGYLPDSVTYEVIAVHACKVKRMDFAFEVLHQMLSQGLRPRRTMHAAFIKGYFWSGRVEDAYKYVVDMSIRDKSSGNMNYSLFASLFQMSGRVIEAGRVLHEMMDSGLRPNFPVYVKVTKDLYRMRSGDLASQLKSMYLKFESSKDVG